MAWSSYMLYFAHIITFGFVIITSIHGTQLLDFLIITATSKLSNYFFGDISTNVLSIIGWVFILFLFNFAAKPKSRRESFTLRVVD